MESNMHDVDIKPLLESLIFVSESPLRLELLVNILPEWSNELILEAIHRIKTEYEDEYKGLELVEVAGGYQFRTKARWAEWVQRLKKAKTVKLSRSALETLAIVAYRQPVIRPVIEDIRGVDSGWVLRTLLEKHLIKIVGRKDIPGRPIVYGTTKTFLEIFNLNTLSDLPTPKEIQLPPIPEELSNEKILKVDDKIEVENEIEEKVEVKNEIRSERGEDIRGPVIHSILPDDEMKE